MPAKKRRRAAAARATGARATAPAPAAPVPEPEEIPPRRGRGAASANPDDEPQWSRFGLLVLLLLVSVLQVIIGAISHLIGHRPRLLIVDLFFFQAPFVLPAAVILMPLAKYLTHQPRTLRLLESLSLGAVFALVSLLLISVFVHPTVPGALSTDQFIDRLTPSDAAGIALADLLAVAASVQLYPGLQRLLSAPGRRARKRLLARNAAAGGRAAAPRARKPPASRRR